jgi:hypothetical protein
MAHAEHLGLRSCIVVRARSRFVSSLACLGLGWVGCGSGATAPSDPNRIASAVQPSGAAGGAARAAGTGARIDTGAGVAGRMGSEGQPTQGSAGRAPASDAGSGAQSTPPAGGFAANQTPADPTITFDWMETRPGGQSDSDCKPGTYAGSFTCEYLLDASDPSTAMEISGPVAFTLMKSQNGEFLEISNGHLDGFAGGFINFTAELSGKLDCSMNSFDAMAVNGVYGLGDVNALPTGTFAGSLSGTLDRSTLTLSGTWILTGDQAISCKGPWMATFQP